MTDPDPALVADASDDVTAPRISVPRGVGRIVGIDVARGIAVLGMIGAHLVLVEPFEWDRSDTWFDLVNGRSAIMFGLLAGVSISLVGERRLGAGADLLSVRLSIVIRALAIFVIGTLLEAVDTAFPIILGTYAVVFVAGAWLISVRSRTLIIASLVAVLLAPPLVLLSRNFFFATDPELPLAPTPLIDIVLLGEFPAVLWVAFLMTGIVVGRLNLGSRRLQLQLGGIGAGLMVLGYGLGEVGNLTVPQDLPEGSWEQQLSTLLLQYPHSATASEATGSAGYAVFVVALCLMACSTRPGQVLLSPLAAVGAMALTVYAGHFVAIALLGSYAEYSFEYGVFLQFLLVTVVFCLAWRLTIGSGPLERIVAHLARAGSRVSR